MVLREISIDEFQSTPPRGGATAMEDNKPADTWISIHAPARGATSVPRCSRPLLTHFNPRPREGGDQYRLGL